MPEEKQNEIKLTGQTVQAIVNYLVTKPYRETAQLIMQIKKEATPQVQVEQEQKDKEG